MVLVYCRARDDDVTVRLTSEQLLELSRRKASLANRSDGAAEASASPLDGTEVSPPGSFRPFHEGDRSGGVVWDSDLPRSLEAGGRYRMDFTYLPTVTQEATLRFTC